MHTSSSVLLVTFMLYPLLYSIPETDTPIAALTEFEEQAQPDLTTEDLALIHKYADINLVVIPAEVKKIMQAHICATETISADELNTWIHKEDITIAPFDLIDKIIEQLEQDNTLSEEERNWIDAYDNALNNNAPDGITRSGSKSFSSLCVSNTLKAGNIEICGNLYVNGIIYGKISPSVQGPVGPQGPQGPQGNPGPTQFGNVARVDAVYGNDTTGVLNGLPFLTINAALAAAQAGDVVWIFPGTYTESFTIPNDVSVIGLSSNEVIIQRAATASTDLVVMGERSSLQNVTLQLTSAAHWQLRGVVFPGTTNATAFMQNVFVTVDNSGATVGGSSDVYGVHVNGSATPTDNIVAISDCEIFVNSIGVGAKRGLLVDGTGSINVKNSQIRVQKGLGAGSAIAAETNNASAALTLRTSTCSATASAGIFADISQTQGTLTLIDTALSGAGANGLGFSTKNAPNTLIWANPATFVAGASLIMRPGTGAAAAISVPPVASIDVSQPMIIRQVSVRATVAPGGVTSDLFIVQKNNIDTALTVALTGAALTNTNSAVSVAFAPGDIITARVARTGAPVTSNATFVMYTY